MKRIGKYEIRGLLGRGGMARVYKVRLPLVEKIAALKQLSPKGPLVNLMGADKVESLFLSEARALSQIRHPNVVDIFDYDVADGVPFFTMDYYCNDLGTMIGEHYMPDRPSRILQIDKAVHYIRQILQGLACLHSMGIVHRDIKPYNILVTEQDTVKITDFGLSRLRGETYEGPDNLMVGSPWYAAPEQEQAPNDADFRADLYSVGVMMYRMLTGLLPEKGTGDSSEHNVYLDENWDEFFRRALSPEPENRFENAWKMIAAVEDLYENWLERKEKICSLEEETDGKDNTFADETDRVRPRSRPVKISPGNARDVFGLDDLWRPRVYVKNGFVLGGDGETVLDRSTGLMWERRGSAFPLNWHDARGYIDGLNEKRFAGYSDWRQPTVNEIMTLLTYPAQTDDFCMETVFDESKKWLWSADRRSFIAAWYVNVELGFAAWHDYTGFFYSKGVREV